MTTTPSFHTDWLAQLIAVAITSLLVGDFPFQILNLGSSLTNHIIIVGAFGVLIGFVIWTMVCVVL